MSLAMVFPGQGSQSVGMQAALAGRYPVVLETYEEASEILGYDLTTLDALASRAAERTAAIPGITDVDTSIDAGVPQQEIRINRAKVADLGLSVRQRRKAERIARRLITRSG